MKLELEPSNGLLFNLDVTLYVVTNLGEIGLHTISIFRIDNLKKFLELSTDLRDLIVRVRVEEDFL